LLARAAQLPEVVLAARRRSGIEARRQELDALHAPGLSVGVAIDRSDPQVWAALATVELGLPWRGRSERERAELRAQSEVTAGERQDLEAQARAQIGRALHEVEHRNEALARLDAELLPAVERGVLARERLFAAGELTAGELIVARRALLVQRLRRERERVLQLLALIELDELRVATGGRAP
jgi:cobalt-zinc-cadmium efflux system outer membrane protein